MPSQFGDHSNQDFLDVLPHVDRLNSWIRSESFRGGLSSGASLRHIIYHYKNEAIKLAQGYGLAAHRLVATSLVCRDCKGAKRYTDQYDFTHPGCRLCRSSGVVKLQFIETTIDAASLVWHSPTGWRHSTSHFGAWREWPEYPTAADWAPNQKGKDLAVDQTAESLMVIERYFPDRPKLRHIDWDYDCSTSVDDFATYSLHVGRTDPECCVLCERQSDLIPGGYGCRAGRITWSATVCSVCRALYSEGVQIFDRCQARLPMDLITPHVAEWIKTHPVPPARSTRG